MTCYYPGCSEKGTTREHIPRRAFFPKGETLQLLTVKSCKTHNNDKSTNDLYVLAQICMNASPNNRAREVFQQRVLPQLDFNNGALRNTLAAGSVKLAKGVRYVVDARRFDEFFTALCCGLIYKSQKAPLPANYSINHIYHRFLGAPDIELDPVVASIDKFYDGKPPEFLPFGNPDTRNERIYTVEIHGVPAFGGSITIVHRFFGVFKVTSMLSWNESPDEAIRAGMN